MPKKRGTRSDTDSTTTDVPLEFGGFYTPRFRGNLSYSQGSFYKNNISVEIDNQTHAKIEKVNVVVDKKNAVIPIPKNTVKARLRFSDDLIKYSV